VEALGGEKWEHLKSRGKQWQTTPKNLPRMQRTRVIPVAWLSSALCPDRPKGWIPIIIIMILPLKCLLLHLFVTFLKTRGKIKDSKLVALLSWSNVSYFYSGGAWLKYSRDNDCHN